MSTEKIWNDLLTIDTENLRVKSREGLHREFKEIYDASSLAKYAKTIASMANAKGGILLFGIAEKPNRLVGIDPTTFPDPATISNSIDKWFEPHIIFSVEEYSHQEFTVIAVNVEESSVKPIICKKNCSIRVSKFKNGREVTSDEPILKEGAIYRRYTAKSKPIQFSELHEIFQQRDRRIISALLENMAHMQRIGVERVGVADMTAIGGNSDISKIYLSKEAIENLNLIDKGKFVETEEEGETSYYVAGTVQLHETTEVPIDDDDRFKPGKVAEELAEDTKSAFFPEFKLSPAQLFKYATDAGYRKQDKTYNNRYCKWDENAECWFYRQAFVDLLRNKMFEDPRDTLLKLSGVANVEKYDRYIQQTGSEEG